LAGGRAIIVNSRLFAIGPIDLSFGRIHVRLRDCQRVVF
jgi:hypothetical protein